MNRPWKCLAAFFFAVALLLPASRSAAAGSLSDWSKGDVQLFEDPAGDTKNYRVPYIPGLDIVAARHAFDGKYHYFRIDLAAEPSLADVPEALRKEYYDTRFGIFINSGWGGARESNRYVPQIPGVDRPENRIDAILDAKLGDWNSSRRYWNGTDFTRDTKVMFQRTGAILEWKYEGDFGADIKWHAAVMIPNPEYSKKTFDFAPAPPPLTGSRLPGTAPAAPR
jgi:hypothetical protein